MTSKSKSVNDEKKTRAIRETKREDFVKVINEVSAIMTADDFEATICKATGNGLYKFSTTAPQDMTGVKKVIVDGLTWYKVPTNDYRISLTSYLQYRLTSKAKADSAALKKFADLTLEQKLALLEKAQELLG